MTPQDIVSLIGVIGSIVVACIAAYNGIAAKVQANANATAHAANASTIADLGDKIHNIALALPSALQTLAPQLQQLTRNPALGHIAVGIFQGMDSHRDRIGLVVQGEFSHLLP